MLSRPSCPLGAVTSDPGCVGYKQLGRLAVPKAWTVPPALPLSPSPAGLRDLGTSFLLQSPFRQHRWVFFYIYRYRFFFFFFRSRAVLLFSHVPQLSGELCELCTSMLGLQQYLHNTLYSDTCSCPLPAVLKDCSIWIHRLTEELKKRREAEEGITFASIHLEMEIAVLVIGWAGSQVSCG